MDQPPRRDNRTFGTRALASMLPRVTGPIFKHRGFAEAGILTDWPAIVGPYLAGHTMPEKISFPRGSRSAGTLHVVSESAFAPELQHVEPQLLERINGYFGYGAVCRLKIQHGRVTHANLDAAPRAQADRRLRGGVASPATLYGDAAVAPGATMAVENQPLRAALDRLGQAVRNRQDGADAAAKARPGGPGQAPRPGAGKSRTSD